MASRQSNSALTKSDTDSPGASTAGVANIAVSIVTLSTWRSPTTSLPFSCCRTQYLFCFALRLVKETLGPIRYRAEFVNYNLSEGRGIPQFFDKIHSDV